MEWSSERRGSSIVVAPVGSVTYQDANDFEANLIPSVAEAADAGGQLIIDFQDVDYMSSVGLRIVMVATREARKVSVEIIIANLNEKMREIFRITHFDNLFQVCESVEAALAS